MTNWNITCEEIYTEEMNIIFTDAQHLPAATYIGNGEWVDQKGQHYIVD